MSPIHSWTNAFLTARRHTKSAGRSNSASGSASGPDVVVGGQAPGVIAASSSVRRLSEGGSSPRSRLGAFDELATKHDLLVLKAELEAKVTAGLASVRNQLVTAQVAAFFGIILYITFKV